MQQHHRIARSIADDRQREWQQAATSDRRALRLGSLVEAAGDLPTAPQPRVGIRPQVMTRISGLLRIGARA